MNLSPKHLINFLEENGFIFKRSKGSHQLYYIHITNNTIIIPVHDGKDMKKGIFLAVINKQDLIKMT
jgi:predicted RNA binding protein YcfA (HicA-like mRNA interferase family)